MNENALDGTDAGRAGPADPADFPDPALPAGSSSTDVCVVGAGPAGLTLALLLLRSGHAVTVVERSRGLDREYRGEILQPGGLAVLGDLGVLAGIQARGAYRLSGFRLLADDKTLMHIEYTRLRSEHNHLLSVPQAHVLAELLEQCGRFPGFAYLPGYRVNGLLYRGAAGAGTPVAGVTASGEDGAHRVHARCVVGADGRYSRTRALAGIDGGRIEAFDQDVLWFKLKAPGRLTGEVRIRRTAVGAVIVHDSYPDSLQIGLTLPHRGYQEFAARGFDHVRTVLCSALPDLADLIGEQVTALTDLRLLDVFAASAERWSADGLVLIGDSAHTHGPLGAQGINLAVQDAALLHPVLDAALRAGEVTGAALAPFEAARRPDIDKVLRTQRMQAKGMVAQNPVADTVRPVAVKLIGRTPIGRKITGKIAFGNPSARVRAELFVQSGSESTPHVKEGV